VCVCVGADAKLWQSWSLLDAGGAAGGAAAAAAAV
jgi:hypothetical protein